MMVSLAGSTIGKYRLIEQLGQGGFASVYKAYQAHLDRYVAIKVLHAHLVEGQDFLARFKREAVAVAALRHPHIVIVYDFDVEQGIYYMVMEFIDGQSLQKRLEQLNEHGGYMPFEEVRRIMHHTTEALDYAHNQGMLHRDVKPSNILLSSSGDAYLTDFGIARILSGTQFTATGALIGTPAYMSPEQAQGTTITPASDVYSLGVMLYELLSGHVPYDADTPLAIILKHLHEPLPSIRKLRPDLPDALENVVAQSLAKAPAERFQSPSALMQALQAALDQVQPGQEPSPATPLREANIPPAATVVEERPPEPAPEQGSHIAASLAADSGAHIPAGKKPSPQAASRPERLEPGQAASLEPTLAVEREPVLPSETVAVEGGPPSVAIEPEPQAAGAPAATLASEPILAPPETSAPPSITGGAPPQGALTAKKSPRKPLQIAGWIVAGLILIGLAYLGFNALRGAAQPNPRATTVAVQPTRQPTLAPTREPTELPSEARVKVEDPLGVVIYRPGEAVRIAAALAISGPNADLGLDAQYGVEIAIDFKDDILGHSIELKVVDDGCSAEGGNAAVQNIVSDSRFAAVIGTSCSSAAAAMIGPISEAGFVMVSPSNTSPAMTDPEGSWLPGYLRTATNDRVQGRAMAEFAFNQLGVKTAAAIHDGDPYTRSLAELFAASFESLGGTITTIAMIERGVDDLKPVLQEVAQASPELLYFPLFVGEGSLVVLQAREVPGFANTILAAADGMISEAAIEAMGAAGEDIYFSGPDRGFSGETYGKFLDAYKQKYGEPISVFHAQAFDAANMIFACLEKVGVDQGGTLQIGRQALRNCLYHTRDFPGITGNLTCSRYGDCGTARISISQLRNGAYVPVWP